MVSTGVLARIPHRIKSMIYLDSFVPEDGKSLFDYDSAVARGIMEANKKENKVIPPFPFDFLGVAEAGIGNFVKQRESPQPWRTMFEPVKALRNHQGIPISYIRCADFKHDPFDEALERIKTNPNGRTAVLGIGHLCMLTDPEETINSLIDLA